MAFFLSLLNIVLLKNSPIRNGKKLIDYSVSSEVEKVWRLRCAQMLRYDVRTPADVLTIAATKVV